MNVARVINVRAISPETMPLALNLPMRIVTVAIISIAITTNCAVSTRAEKLQFGMITETATS